jgi:hypothetical protein
MLSQTYRPTGGVTLSQCYALGSPGAVEAQAKLRATGMMGATAGLAPAASTPAIAASDNFADMKKTGTPSLDAHYPEVLNITAIADGLPADMATPLRRQGSRNSYSETYARPANAERLGDGSNSAALRAHPRQKSRNRLGANSV